LLPLCRTLLAAASPANLAEVGELAAWHCPRCQGLMRVVEFLTSSQVLTAEARPVDVHDTS
jgi:hypothetical protein